MRLLIGWDKHVHVQCALIFSLILNQSFGIAAQGELPTSGLMELPVYVLHMDLQVELLLQLQGGLDLGLKV